VVPLERFRDLVFSPLALPPPPPVDGERLVGWMSWAHAEALKRGHNRSERGYEERTGRRYPWLMATVLLSDPGPVERSFEREFPAIKAYLDLFPFRGVGCLNLLAQRAEAEVFLHTDTDGFWCFRFYLAQQRREDLYFCMARKRVTSLPQRVDDWSAHLDTRTQHQARWPAENRPFCLSSVRAAHAVKPNPCRLGERIACLVIPEHGHDEARLLDLLERSSARFAQHQIWYSAP